MKATKVLLLECGSAASSVLALMQGKSSDLNQVRIAVPKISDRALRVEVCLELFQKSRKAADLQLALDMCRCLKKADPAGCDRALKSIVQVAVEVGEFPRARDAAHRMMNPRLRREALNGIVLAERAYASARRNRQDAERRESINARRVTAAMGRGAFVPEPAMG